MFNLEKKTPIRVRNVLLTEFSILRTNISHSARTMFNLVSNVGLNFIHLSHVSRQSHGQTITETDRDTFVPITHTHLDTPACSP